jgi:hypothetical protein
MGRTAPELIAAKRNGRAGRHGARRLEIAALVAMAVVACGGVGRTMGCPTASRGRAEAHAGTDEIELFPLYLDGEAIEYLQPVGGSSWRLALPPGAPHPHQVVHGALAQLGGTPVMVHSTSWRYESGHVVLTYVAVLPAPPVPRAGFQSQRVAPQDLAHSTATRPPGGIEVGAVVNHALRHMAWLLRTDPSVAGALREAWSRALAPYHPDPFRSMDEPACAAR